MSVTLEASLIQLCIGAISSIEGKKPILMSVDFVRAQKKLAEFDKAWRDEGLDDAIKEFTDGGDVIKDEEFKEFTETYKDLFEEKVEIDIESFSAQVLDDAGLTIGDYETALLLQTGLLVD